MGIAPALSQTLKVIKRGADYGAAERSVKHRWGCLSAAWLKAFLAVRVSGALMANEERLVKMFVDMRGGCGRLAVCRKTTSD